MKLTKPKIFEIIKYKNEEGVTYHLGKRFDLFSCKVNEKPRNKCREFSQIVEANLRVNLSLLNSAKRLKYANEWGLHEMKNPGINAEVSCK